MMTRSRIVVDECINSYATTLEEMCSSLNSAIARYVNILEKTRNTAIMSGAAADRLASFTESAAALKGGFQELGVTLNAVLVGFQKDVDDADKYLY